MHRFRYILPFFRIFSFFYFRLHPRFLVGHPSLPSSPSLARHPSHREGVGGGDCPFAILSTLPSPCGGGVLQIRTRTKARALGDKMIIHLHGIIRLRSLCIGASSVRSFVRWRWTNTFYFHYTHYQFILAQCSYSTPRFSFGTSQYYR